VLHSQLCHLLLFGWFVENKIKRLKKIYKLIIKIYFRQTAPAPATPPPLTIREKAPTPPTISEPTIIEVNIQKKKYASIH
jgi:hypothetical protein